MANEFLPHATGGGSNVITQSAWSALAARLTGFQAGVAKSDEVNKALRQATSIAAMIGQFISDRGGVDALDNANIGALLDAFEAAYRKQATNYVPTVGGTANALTAMLDPVPASYASLTGTPFLVKIATTNTGAATINLNGLGAATIGRPDNTALQAGDLQAGRTVAMMFDGTFFQLLGLAASSAGRLIGIQIFTSSGTYTPTAGMTFCIMEGVGGGGAGGGATNPGAGNVSLGAPGTAGTWGKARFTASTIGASKVVTIGAGGNAAAGSAGANGGDTLVAGILQLPGGRGGGSLNNQVPPTPNGNGLVSPVAVGANIASRSGTAPFPSIGLSGTAGIGAPGGDSPLGAGGYSISANTNGVAANGNGAGGSGICLTAGGGLGSGGVGSPGILIILEYGA